MRVALQERKAAVAVIAKGDVVRLRVGKAVSIGEGISYEKLVITIPVWILRVGKRSKPLLEI